MTNLLPVLTVNNLSKVVEEAGERRSIFKGVSFEVPSGQVTAITGRSGVGKSTLLACVAGIDQATSGEINIKGRRFDRLSETERAAFRLKEIGIVFQFFNFLPNLSVFQNIALPAHIAGVAEQQLASEIKENAELLGIANLLERLPEQISGGELQRAALARALMNKPNLLLADEPTGNLDSDNADLLLKLLNSLAARKNLAVLLVTHEPGIRNYTDRVLELTPVGISEARAV